MLFGKKIIAFLTVLVVLSTAELGAQENNGIEMSTELGVEVSTNIELKALVTQNFVFPFLQGSGALTEGNNLKTALTFDITPISLNGALELTLTPIAFLQVVGGGKIGSGWDINLFGTDIYGIGLNIPSTETVTIGHAPDTYTARRSNVISKSFDGFMWSAWGGAAFQFDLAAVLPGDWNHVLFRTYHEMKYASYTKAGSGGSWFFEDDYGENRNGWIYNASYVIAYQMPLSPVLDTVGLMAEMRKNLYPLPSGVANDTWGDSLGYWVLSGLFNFTLSPKFSFALAAQIHTRRNHGLTDLENTDILFYQDLKLQGNQGTRRMVFHRAALILNYKLR